VVKGYMEVIVLCDERDDADSLIGLGGHFHN
jgi:hypothetical protein